MSFECSLIGCDHTSTHKTGRGAHERGHLLRGEAYRGDDGQLHPTGVPLAITSSERKRRMNDVHAGKIKSYEFGGQPTSNEIMQVEEPEDEPETQPDMEFEIDIDSMSDEQLFRLRERLSEIDGHAHSCPQSRASERLADAVVLQTVSQMLDDTPAEQMLLMLNQLRKLPQNR